MVDRSVWTSRSAMLGSGVQDVVVRIGVGGIGERCDFLGGERWVGAVLRLCVGRWGESLMDLSIWSSRSSELGFRVQCVVVHGELGGVRRGEGPR